MSDEMMSDIIRNGREAKLPYELPKPCKRDGNGKLCKAYSAEDWLHKIFEEVLEVDEALVLRGYEVLGTDDIGLVASEVADIITVCTSWLEALGYDEEARAELFHRVNEKNQKRGYLED